LRCLLLIAACLGCTHEPDHGLFVLFNCYFPACTGNNALQQIQVCPAAGLPYMPMLP
jgi:hypothetical protein